MTDVHDRIQTIISSQTRDLDQIERTLTDGYAEALSLEAESWRLERQMAQVTEGIAQGDTEKNAHELAALATRLNGNQGALARLRSRLADLRGYASGIRGAKR